MNFSLRNRIAISFVTANLIVLVLGLIVFFYLDSLNRDIERITENTNKLTMLTEETRISTVAVLKYQRKVLTKKAVEEDVEKLIDLCDVLLDQLEKLKNFYQKETEVRDLILLMRGYVDSLKVTLGKASLFHRDTSGLKGIEDLADKILDTFTEFQDIQFTQSEERDKQMRKIIGETKRNMLITLIITFLGTILLSLIVPGKIALPFKKINDAIRELQECNFDVSIYYNQDDEIGEIAREMNKMIHSFKKFEELRTDRISVELRKFDALASIVQKMILVANANGELVYMNNSLYSLLQLQSDDIVHKNMSDTRIPECIKDAYNLALKRRSKIDNAEIHISKKFEDGQEVPEGVKLDEAGEGEVFTGFANVIPIRGKESSLDYYLMVISSEVYV